MRSHYPWASAAFAAGLLVVGKALADDSPLQVVLDGREKAASSNMSEAGIKGLATSGGNVLLYGAGLAGICMVFGALWYLWTAQDDPTGNTSGRTRAGWAMLIIGSLATIPAIVAAVVPHLMGI
jgi:hypothetical protein